MMIVQGLWVQDSLPPIQRLSIKSFLDHGHEYHLYAYNEIAGVPAGTTLCDASAILPPEGIFTYADGFGKGSYSAFSNLFRYKLIFEKGGWWVDTDVVCLRPFDFRDDFVLATEYEDDYSVLAATCVFKSPSGADYLDYCLKVSQTKDKKELRWSEIGPYLFDEAIKRFDLTRHLTPVHVFNPINHFACSDILKPAFDPSTLAGSYAVHLWNQRWKSQGMEPERDARPDSLYARLCTQHLTSDAAM